MCPPPKVSTILEEPLPFSLPNLTERSEKVIYWQNYAIQSPSKLPLCQISVDYMSDRDHLTNQEGRGGGGWWLKNPNKYFNFSTINILTILNFFICEKKRKLL